MDEVEIEKPKLIRQNTFTKDSTSTSEIAAASTYGHRQESSSSLTAAIATASKRSIGKSAVFQNHGEVKLIGGSIVRKNVDSNSHDSVDYKDLRASVSKPTDNLQLAGSVDYQSKQEKRSSLPLYAVN